MLKMSVKKNDASSPKLRPRPTRALSTTERARVLVVLDDEPFMDKAPAQVYAKLLEDGECLCSNDATGDLAELVSVLAAYAPRTLRRLRLGTELPWSSLRGSDFGRLDGLWRSMPRLHELRIRGRVGSLGSLDLPELRRVDLDLVGATLGPAIPAISNARWPCLEAFRLWGGDAIDAVAAIVARDDLVVLGELAVLNCAFANELPLVLAASPLAPQLHRLSFAHGAFTDHGVGRLVNERTAFPNLSVLDVSETLISKTGVERLRAVVPTVIAKGLREGAPRTAIPDEQ